MEWANGAKIRVFNTQASNERTNERTNERPNDRTATVYKWLQIIHQWVGISAGRRNENLSAPLLFAFAPSIPHLLTSINLSQILDEMKVYTQQRTYKPMKKCQSFKWKESLLCQKRSIECCVVVRKEIGCKYYHKYSWVFVTKYMIINRSFWITR